MRKFSAVVLSSLLWVGCAGGPPAPQASPSAFAKKRTQPGQPAGLSFSLHEGAAVSQNDKSSAPALSPLPSHQAEQLLALLPALSKEPAQPLALRPSSLPIPRAAKLVSLPFPPPRRQAPPIETATLEPLKVERITPQGDVEMAPQLAVTFSQPMVELTDLKQLESKAPPVKLTPQPEGKWRWLGTQTILFVPKVRLPMATDYRVEIPSGTRSSAGERLEQAARATFSTPAPRLLYSWPRQGGQPLSPTLFLGFDQRVDATAVLSRLRLSGGQTGPLALRLATAQESGLDDQIQSLAEQAGEGRWLAVVPTRPLPAGCSFTLEVGRGTPSLEGPKSTQDVQSFSFSTYDPLKIVWKTDDTSPGQPWTVSFNNNLDEEKFRPEWVSIEPPLEQPQIRCSSGQLSIFGCNQGNRHYQVRLSPDVVDAFGQKLGPGQNWKIKVGPAEPYLRGPSQSLLVLNPAAPRQLEFQVMNHKQVKVRVWKVGLQDWPAFVQYLQDGWRNPLGLKAPGQLVLDELAATGVAMDQESTWLLPLDKYLQAGLGHLVVMVEPYPLPSETWQRQPYLGWVQSTQLGLDAMVDPLHLIAAVNDLASGRPLSGVDLRLGAQGRAQSSDAQGLARLDYSGDSLLVAQKGQDVAFLPQNLYDHGAWSHSVPQERQLWHVVDDRQLYRPKEKVHLKGWLRTDPYGPESELAATRATTVSYLLRDNQGNEILTGKSKVGPLGGFDLSFALPAQMHLGQAQLELSSDAGGSHDHSFRVEEFRRPEFEVAVEAQPNSSQIGSSSTLSLAANYFSGGGLSGAKVDWHVSAQPSSYSPPGWEEFTFGIWTPWWDYRGWRGQSEPRAAALTHSQMTDGKGKSYLKVDFHSADPPRPYSLVAQATVLDINRQSWTSSSTVLVHPASVYVGLKAQRTFVKVGQSLDLDLVVTDLQGKCRAGLPVQLRAKCGDEVVEQSVTSAEKPRPVKFALKRAGVYTVEAVVFDEGNLSNSCQLTTWVAGSQPTSSSSLAQDTLNLVPDRKEYEPGQSAEVLVQVPFAPAHLTVTTRRQGVATLTQLEAPDGTATLKIPLQEKHIPGLDLEVRANGQKSEGNKKLPAFASGSLNLQISRASRRLQVVVTPTKAQLKPGESTSVEVSLKDHQGRPVAGEVALLAVDESVLALTGYDPADPLNSFCVLKSGEVSDVHLRHYVERPAPLAQTNDARESMPLSSSQEGAFADATSASVRGGAAPPMPAAAPEPDLRRKAESDDKGTANKNQQSTSLGALHLRRNFEPLALFEAQLQCDASGRATATVKLPDNLTRYRIVALAASGVKQFGKGQSQLVARQPLQIRPALPRFLNFGDEAQLAVVVQNQTDQAERVEMAARASNLKLKEQGYHFEVPAQGRVEVVFPASTQAAGKARLQFVARSSQGQDAAELSLPVWTPATSEAFATYGVLDQGATQQAVRRPEQVFPQFGELSVTTSSTALAELTDAWISLCSYPFECSEQVSSRMLAGLALHDVLGAFKAPGMATRKDLQESLGRDFQRLQSLQNDDGGWDYWVRGKPSSPWVSVHVAHALVLAKQKGFEPPAGSLSLALSYLENIDQHIPTTYGPESRRSIRAYACAVLHQSGQPQGQLALSLAKQVKIERLGFEVIGLLLPCLPDNLEGRALREEMLGYLDNQVTQTAAAANFSQSYADQDYLILYSDRRDDALLLRALMATRSNSKLIPKLVRGLLDGRRAGHWASTQEDCWVLLALDDYFRRYEAITPDFVARCWLGQDFAGEMRFRGRQKDEQKLSIPLAQMPKSGDLLLSKEGPGRLYYRLGLTYAPKDLKQAAADYGFAVSRNYVAIEDNNDVRQDEKGVWHIKAGAQVRVELTMHAPSRRYHVALVDPLPAGLEAVNPSLLGGRPVGEPPSNRGDGWWSRYWYEHTNLRDERVEAFTQLLWEGVYHYSYVARATSKGTFQVPPCKAEEMYHSETFGRSSSDQVVVE